MKLIILALFACIVSVYCGGYSHDNHHDMYHDHGHGYSHHDMNYDHGHGYSHHDYGNRYHVIKRIYRPYHYRSYHSGRDHSVPLVPLVSSPVYPAPLDQSYSAPIESS